MNRKKEMKRLRKELKDSKKLYSFVEENEPELSEKIKNEALREPMFEDEYEDCKEEYCRMYIEENISDREGSKGIVVLIKRYLKKQRQKGNT